MTVIHDPKTSPQLSLADAPRHRTSAQEEKLRRLSDMKYDLERQSGRGTADLEQLEARIASVDLAISREKTR